MNDNRPTDDFGLAEESKSRRERKLTSEVELNHHKRAFQIYCTMGSRRSYRAVALEFAVSHSTVKNWSRRFRWRDRLQEWEAVQTRRMMEQTNQHAQDSLMARRKILDRQLAWLIRCMTEGKIRFSTRDLSRLESLATQLELLIDYLENPNRLRSETHLIMIPDNGQDGGESTMPESDGGNTPIPESQLEEYIASLEYDPSLEYGSFPEGTKPRWRKKKV